MLAWVLSSVEFSNFSLYSPLEHLFPSVLLGLIRQELLHTLLEHYQASNLSFHITWLDPCEPNLYRNPGFTLQVQRKTVIATLRANPDCYRARAVEMILLSPKLIGGHAGHD